MEAIVPDAVQGGLHLSELPAPLRLDGHVLVLTAPAEGEVLAQGRHAIRRRLQHLDTGRDNRRCMGRQSRCREGQGDSPPRGLPG